MDKHKTELLEAAGWTVGTVAEFLGLTAEESEIVELRLELGDSVQDPDNSEGIDTKV